MPLDAPVTSATGRVEFAMVTNPQVMNSLAMIPLRGAYSLNPVL
jgi:hypothetical protein